jgi:hypothetical protein
MKVVIHDAFGSMQQYAQIQLGRLKADPTKAEKPNWTEKLLEGLLDVCFKLSGERVGEYLAEHLLAEGAEALASVMKKSCEEAAPAGVSLAMERLAGNESPDVETFIGTQQVGVVAMYQEAQARFVEAGQDKIATTKEAHRIKRALSAPHLVEAAQEHYRVSRDRYLTALAQQTLGVTADGRTDVSPGEHKIGHGPDFAWMMMGVDRGVLEADVMLHDDVREEPGVYRALLHGVNETIRKQYEHVPLSSVKIPRVLVCSVRGDMSDFTVNVDETGAMQLAHGSGEWLEKRAQAERPDSVRMSRAQQQQLGLDLLLRDLEVDELGRGGRR